MTTAFKILFGLIIRVGKIVTTIGSPHIRLLRKTSDLTVWVLTCYRHGVIEDDFYLHKKYFFLRPHITLSWKCRRDEVFYTRLGL